MSELRKDALYQVQIKSPAGVLVSLKDADFDTAWAACNAVEQSTKDEKLKKMVGDCIRSFGFMGTGHGEYSVDISAYLPRTDTGEKQTCGRRMRDFGRWEREENLDTWELRGADKCCSFCGSLHPDRVLELVKEHGPGIIQRSTKSYKWYLHRSSVPNAYFGGIKYYRYHDTQEFLDELSKLIDASNQEKAAA